MDPAWTDLVDDHDVDIADVNTWALLLRNEYCKDIREYKYWEYVYDVPNFVASGAEPNTCMQNTNIIKIVKQIFENMGNNWYFGNYNGWLRQRRDEENAGKLSFTCDLTKNNYFMFVEKGKTKIEQEAKINKDLISKLFIK
jgi:hypothetical protein